MIRRWPVVLLAGLLLAPAAARGGGAAAVPAVGKCDEAVDFIRAHVRCKNPREVARLVFGRTSCDWPGAATWQSRFSVDELGDGTRVYIFEPPGGSGNWANRPSYHFVRERGALELIFDGGGNTVSYLKDKPKIHHRYQIMTGWRADGIGDLDPELEPHVRGAYGSQRYFWSDRAYLLAYEELEIVEADDPALVGVRRTWNEATKAQYLALTRTPRVRTGH